MKELKTLKDIYKDIGKRWGEQVVQVNELRQEAVKWIKKIKKEEAKGILWDTIGVLETFFNITEEDLTK